MPHMKFPEHVTSISDSGHTLTAGANGLADTSAVPGDVLRRMVAASGFEMVDDAPAAVANQKVEDNEKAAMIAQLQEGGYKVDGRTPLARLRTLMVELETERAKTAEGVQTATPA